MATNRTAWASIDLGGEQVLQEVEVVWHLQHPRRYEVQTSLDGVTWVSRAVQVNACNPCAQAATLCDIEAAAACIQAATLRVLCR